MFVCNCNGLNTRQVKTAILEGASSPSAIYAFHDCEPKCGRCACEMRELIRLARNEAQEGQRQSNEPAFDAQLSPAMAL